MATLGTRNGIPASLPISNRGLLLIVLAYLVPGLVGHDPWKSDDAIAIGVVYDMLDQGHWLSPSLAGVPWLRDGPLYFWLAAICAKSLSWLIPLHDAARIPSLLSIIAALYFTRLSARELYGKRAGELSLLALLGCGGLVLQARLCTPATLSLAALAACYYGVSIAWKKPLKGGLCIGTGLAAALLATGASALLPPLIALVIMMPVAHARGNRNFLFATGLGLLLALVLALPWFIVLHLLSPGTAAAWVGSQLHLLVALPLLSLSLEHLQTVAWVAWPVWPLALLAFWVNRRQLNNVVALVPLIVSLVSVVLLVFDPDPRPIDVLPLLAPLSIPAGVAALQLRRGASNALAWFSVMTFTLLIALIWLLWLATTLGMPHSLASAATRLEPGYQHSFSWFAVLLAIACSLLWGRVVQRTAFTSLRGIPLWTTGASVISALVLLLGIQWIDYGKSYRSVAQALRNHLPERVRCIESQGLGEVQRAVFHYHGNLITRAGPSAQGASGPAAESGCNVLLVQAYADDATVTIDKRWRIVWEASRPRDRERYRLYVR